MRKYLKFDKKHIAYKALVLLWTITNNAQAPVQRLLFCDGERAIATDSKRLTTCNSDFLDTEPGFYEMIKYNQGILLLPVDSEEKFVDYERVLNKDEVTEAHDIRNRNKFSAFVADILNAPSFNMAVELDFLKDIYSTINPFAKAFYVTANYPIIIESGEMTHVIMPINVA